MRLRTPDEQRGYLDGYEKCAENIEKYLSDEGKKMLKCQLMAVRNAVEIKDVELQENEKVCCNCKYNKRYEGDDNAIYCWCNFTERYLSYAEVMTGWCRHWAKDKEVRNADSN